MTELLEFSDYELEMQGRITHPMEFDAAQDRYVPVTWEHPFERVGAILKSYDDPNVVEFYTSGRASNEAAFLFQLFGRLYGTNNFPDCSNMCHEASSQGLPPQLGIGKGTVLLEDFDFADAIFIFGQNPGTNSPRMMSSLREASRRGCRIVSFNPFLERALERFQAPQAPIEMATMTSTPISAHIFQVKVDGDVAVCKGMCKALLEMDERAIERDDPRPLDMNFIEGHTHGFDEFCVDLRATSWTAIEQQSGLSKLAIEEAALIYAQADSVIGVWGMGVTQHRHGTHNVQQIVNLLLMRGNMGRPGAGACPVRGHSNVQGNRTVGISEKPTSEFLDALGKAFGFEPPRANGHDVVRALDAMVAGTAKAFIALGGNFAAAIPDTEITQLAMRKLDLTVQITTKLNRGHLIHGRDAFMLPCLGRSEVDIQAGGSQRITVEDSMSMVHASRGSARPPSDHVRSEVAIVAGLGKASTLTPATVDWDGMTGDYAAIRRGIERVLPLFQGYEARIEHPGGFHLTNAARERIWLTATGKANFMVYEGLEEDPRSADPFALRLTTMRSHDQYNTTLYSLSDRYRGVFDGRWVVFVNAAEMERRGLQDGDKADLETIADDGVQRCLRGLRVIRYDIPDGCCGAYYPEANPLVPLALHDPISGTPSYKSIPVRLIASSVTQSAQ